MVRDVPRARPPAAWPPGVGAGTYAAAVITLQAIVETVPPDHTGVDPDRQVRDVEVRGETYEAARAALDAQVPDDHRLVWVRTI